MGVSFKKTKEEKETENDRVIIAMPMFNNGETFNIDKIVMFAFKINYKTIKNKYTYFLICRLDNLIFPNFYLKLIITQALKG